MNRFDSLDSLEREPYLIKCPVCGQEYLPAELFLPEDVLGSPTDIVKRNDGKLDFYLGERPTYETEYCCDNCNNTFRVKMKVFFETSVEDDFDAAYSSKLKTNVLAGEVDLFNDKNTAERK